MSVLQVTDLTVRFGGLVALDGVTLSVADGELHGLIGPNGAGKTTLIDAVSGFQEYGGSVAMSGVPLDGLRPDERARRGLRRTFQSLDLFDDLTVGENISVSTARGRDSEDSSHAIAATGLADVVDVRAAALPFVTRRFAAIARALAGRPRVLLVDEVAAGLDLDGRQRVARCLRDVVAAGTSVVLVDHDMGLVLAVSDAVTVLHRGAVIAAGPPSEISRDRAVVTAYLGRRR